MTPALLVLALAGSAAAQSPMPYSGDATQAASPAPAASTAAAVSSSTDTLSNVVTSTAGVKVGGGAPKAKLARPLHAIIHPDSKDWEPLAVKAGGDPFQAETRVILREEKSRGKYKGAAVKATSSARLYKAGEDRWLVVRVFPKAPVEKRRVHFEVRLKIVEGYVEEVKAAAVTVVDERANVGAGLDAHELRDRGIEFEEDTPASGTLVISALDPRPSKSAVNSGALKLASFAGKALGLADVSWSAKGLPPAK
ncbi:MAG TPA: hypothetical protein VN915_09805 [Elusimicrobiota bacterium]|nr:hypothetical protein [Elusimicrobiota bacterium]